MEQLYYNGKIITMSEQDFVENPVEAVLVRDGLIVAAGSLEDIRSMAGESCTMVDLEG